MLINWFICYICSKTSNYFSIISHSTMTMSVDRQRLITGACSAPQMNGTDIWHRVVLLEPAMPFHTSGTPEQQSSFRFSSETEIYGFMCWKAENWKTVKCFHTWASNCERVDSNTPPGLSVSILAHTLRAKICYGLLNV